MGKKICTVEFLSVVAWCTNWGGNREGDKRGGGGGDTDLGLGEKQNLWFIYVAGLKFTHELG